MLLTEEEKEEYAQCFGALCHGYNSAIAFRDAAELNRKAYNAAMEYLDREDQKPKLKIWLIHAFIDGYRDSAKGSPPKPTKEVRYYEMYMEGYNYIGRMQ